MTFLVLKNSNSLGAYYIASQINKGINLSIAELQHYYVVRIKFIGRNYVRRIFAPWKKSYCKNRP